MSTSARASASASTISSKIHDIIRDQIAEGKKLTAEQARMHARYPGIVDQVMANQNAARVAEAAEAANTSRKRKATTNATGTTTKKQKAATAKAVPVKKGAATKATTTTAAASSKKRKGETSATGAAPAKKARTTTTKAKAAPAKKAKPAKGGDEEDDKPPVRPVAKPKTRRGPAPKVINEAPTKRLNVYVFGEGSNGELGLGHKHAEGKRVIDVKRPRLNPNLLPESVGVVQVATGGMHVAALTSGGVILTWGVNDQGALGRETKQAEQFRDADASENSDDEEEDSGMNPLEAAPGPVSLENIPEGTVFTRVAAGDSVTMAVTNTGLVYGCGTFRSNEGILGFSADSTIQTTLVQVPGLKNVVDVVCGDNHVVALDNKGNCFAWGSGQQNQLGRRVVERTRMNGLVPRDFGLPKGKITHIAAGAYHSFAIDKSDRVWTWGLNNFGETGIAEGAGEDGAMVLKPAVVKALDGKKVVGLAGGAHHSLAVTSSGSVLAWGRADGAQSGIDPDSIPSENFFVDAEGKKNERLLMVPTVVPDIEGAVHVAAGTDSSMAVTEAGKAYTWGFSENYQTGQGTTEDVEEATLVDNTAVRDKKLVWAGAGGQYAVLASEVEMEE